MKNVASKSELISNYSNMNVFRLLALFLLMIISTLSIAQNKFDGLWTGTIAAGGIEMQIDFEITEAEQKVLMSVPIQNIKDIESSTLVIKGDTLTIMYMAFRARYDAIYDQKSEAFIGEWNQGRATPLNLKRTDTKTEFKRPQTPEEPFPYDVKDVSIQNELAGVNLAGTLTTPKGDGPFPLAILVSGSGRQNRNSNILGHKPFLVIADYLTRAGIAVIRYDDRGVDKSTGNHAESTSADFADDANSVFQYTKTLDKIDKSKIGIIGHSEGGMIALIVASLNRDLGYVVSLAGPGVPISDLMTCQNAMVLEKSGMSPEGLEITKQNLPLIYSIVNQDKEPKQLFDTLINAVHGFYDKLPKVDQKLLAPTKASYYMSLAQSFFSPWFRYFLAYDPTESWQQTKCPVLALNGSEDIQVEAKMNTNAIMTNLAISGNNKAQIKIVDGLNHLFQPCVKCNLAEYATIETTFDESVLGMIRDFISKL
ncbi:MAG: pimeloyl-ACP methyl ester carboxylesterase [Halioglobus sp.]